MTPNVKLRAMLVPARAKGQADASQLIDSGSANPRGQAARIRWARLLKRVFEIDMEHCLNCGGQIKIIATILEPAVIERILKCLGLQARALPGRRRAETFSRLPNRGPAPLGLPRLRCADYGHNKLVAFSCKRIRLCPYGARRMSQTAAHMVNQVIPRLSVRQQVPLLPIPLRLALAAQSSVATPSLQVVP